MLQRELPQRRPNGLVGAQVGESVVRCEEGGEGGVGGQERVGGVDGG